MDWPRLPDYGCIPRWPQDGTDFIHCDDVSVAQRCFPSERVFRRDTFDGEYYHYRYGHVRFRLRPSMWLPVLGEGFNIGDSVETIGVGMGQELFVAKIWGMHFVRRKGCILYRLWRRDAVVPKLFHAAQIRSLVNKTIVME